MKRVIPFTNFRYGGYAISSFLLVAGLVGTILRGGFNIGIDFQAGISEQIQIAPPAFTMAYTGKNTLSLNMSGNALTINLEDENGTQKTDFAYSKYATLGAIETALGALPGVTVTPKADSTLSTAELVGISSTVEVGATPLTINVIHGAGGTSISIDEVRSALSSLGDPLVQVIGQPSNQEFLLRVQNKQKTTDFQQVMTQKVSQLLGDKFGADNIVVKQTSFVGGRFSANLTQQAITLTLLALLLIMIYIWIRFKLSYAVAATIATIHDPLIMIGFIGVFQLEVNTATIAAVLTIVGYSLNDTIVVMDRIRENRGLMRETSLRTVIDASVTQVLSRTIITSLTVLLAVVSILVFTTGSIEEFALNMVVGVVIGTYSSIFIAAQILRIWEDVRDRRKKRSDALKYGTHEAIMKANAEGGEVTAAAATSTSTAVAGSDNKPAEIIIPHVERKLHGKRRKKK